MIFFIFFLEKKIYASNNNNQNIRITAILPNPQGKDIEKEWIQIYNSSENEINMNNFKIQINDKTAKNISDIDIFIQPKQLFYLTANKEIFKNIYNKNNPLIKLPITITNSKSEIKIIDLNNNIIDKITYTNTDEDIITYVLINCNKQKYTSLNDFNFTIPLQEKCIIQDKTDKNNTQINESDTNQNNIQISEKNSIYKKIKEINILYNKILQENKINIIQAKAPNNKEIKSNINENNNQNQTITQTYALTKSYISISFIPLLIALSIFLYLLLFEFQVLYFFQQVFSKFLS